MKLRVLQLCHDYGGPFVTVCRQYVEAFPDAEVTTIFIQGESSDRVREEVGGANVLFLSKAGDDLRGFKFSQITRLQKLLGETSFGVVIAHRYKAIYLAGILSYFRKFPVLLGVAHEHKVFKRITRKLFVTLWRRNIILAGVSESVVADINKYCPSLARNNRLHCLNNVLPLGFSEQMVPRAMARQTFGFQATDFVVGSIGRLVKKKSLPTLVNAFAMFAKGRPEIKLALIGDGPLRLELQELVAKLEIEDQVKFLGHVTNAGLSASALDVFVLPSGDAEAFGIVLLEAMMAEVPVITSQAPGPSKVVGKERWQFETESSSDLASKLRDAYELSPKERQDLVEDNRRHVETTFSPRLFREKLLSIAKG